MGCILVLSFYFTTLFAILMSQSFWFAIELWSPFWYVGRQAHHCLFVMFHTQQIPCLFWGTFSFFFLSFFFFGGGHTCGVWRFPGYRWNQRLQLPAYTTAHSNTGSLTHWAGPRSEPMSLWMNSSWVNHCWATTGTPLSFFFLILKLYWSIIDLRCDNFCCTTKCFSYTHTLSHSFSNSFPI